MATHPVVREPCPIAVDAVHHFVLGSDHLKDFGLLVLFCAHCARVEERAITDAAVATARADELPLSIMAPGGSD